MKDVLFKIYVLFKGTFKAIMGYLSYWYSEIWKKDLDSFVCCNGYMCGCQATTIREECNRI